MPREKYKTLTEQMFYILLCLHQPRCGADILEAVRRLTGGRVTIGSGTLYDLLVQFTADGFLQQQPAPGRGRIYQLTDKGRQLLVQEYRRLCSQAGDFVKVFGPLPTTERPAGESQEEDAP